MRLQEIEEALSHFKICHECNSKQGFWVALQSDRACVQCKCCGAKFELHKVYMMNGEGKTPRRLRFLRK